ncbi:MAG: hypothetical protein NC180_00620 [Muribaculaceae bacterium]|nr:hypothetical protein [Roseburia sp.]MCM1430923.1 hypothetical protein [Muribaculaceae bacterium]MCM1491716.1 hypothetical protein [Muribaculaceae bacterium]
MADILTWEQIQEKYPDQWVGLVDVEYMDNDGVSVASAVVKYADKANSELTRMVLDGEIISRHTNPAAYSQDWWGAPSSKNYLRNYLRK